ncbi:MAG: hypothetical protein ACE5JD_06325 [Candidatus Methylomirabilia bacterium]
MTLEIPDPVNAAAWIVDRNVAEGRGNKTAVSYEHMLNDSRAKIVIAHEEVMGNVVKIRDHLRHLRHMVVAIHVARCRRRCSSSSTAIGRASSLRYPPHGAALPGAG